MEKVTGSNASAPEAFFSLMSFRMSRIW